MKHAGIQCVWRGINPLSFLAVLGIVLCAGPSVAQQTDGSQVSQHTDSFRLRYVYVPVQFFEAAAADFPRGRFMDLLDLLPLLEKAPRVWSRAGFPGGDAVVLAARYEGALGDRSIDLSGEVRLAKLGEEWTLVPLPVSNVVLKAVTLDGEPWPVLRRGDAAVIPLRGSGEHVLGLSGAIPVEVTEGNPTAAFQLPAGAAGQLSLKLPPGRRLLVDGELVEGYEQNGGKVAEVALPSDRPLTLAAILEESEAQRRTVLVARHRCLYTVRPDGLDVEQTTRLTVYAFPVQQVAVSFPSDLELVQVNAPQLKRWQLERGEGGDLRLVLFFTEPFRGLRDVTIRAVLPRREGEGVLELPRILVSRAASQTGILVIRTDPGLRSEVLSLEGVRYLNLAERVREGLDNVFKTPGQVRVLGFWTPEYAVRLYVRRVQPEVLVGAASVVMLNPARALLRSSLTVETRYGPLTGLSLTVPESWRLLRVGMPDDRGSLKWRAYPEDGRTVVDLQFAPPIPEGKPTVILLEAERWRQPGETRASFDLPSVEVRDVPGSEGTVVVAAHESLDVRFPELRNLEPVPPEGELASVVNVPGQRVIKAFRYVGAYSGTIEVTPRAPRLSGKIFLRVSPARELAQVQGLLQVSNNGGPSESISLFVPDRVAAGFRVLRDGQGMESVREIRRDPTEGGVLVRLLFTEAFKGQIEIPVQYSVRPDPGDNVIVLPLPWVEEAETVQGYVAVDAPADLEVVAEGAGVEPIPVSLLPEQDVFRAPSRTVAAFRYRSRPAELRLSLEQHPIAAVPDSYCPGMRVLSTIKPGGVVSHAVWVPIKSVGRQYVHVALPEEATVRAVLVDGAPVTVHPSRDGLAVPLPSASVSQRNVFLLYDTPAPPEGYKLTMGAASPRIDAPVGELSWVLVYPPQYDPASVSGDAVLRTKLPSASLMLPEEAGSIELILSVGVVALVVAGIVSGVAVVLLWVGSSVRAWYSRVMLLLILGGPVLSLTLSGCLLAYRASSAARCEAHLRVLYEALEQYHQQYGQYPPAALGPSNVPLDRQFSWAVALLPYLGEEELYAQLDLSQPVDAPVNAVLLEGRGLSVFQCPHAAGFDSLSYLAVLGARMPGGEELEGVFGWHRSLSREQISDPPGTTLLLLETTRPARWYVASEAAIQLDPYELLVSDGRHANRLYALCADGDVVLLPWAVEGDMLVRLASARAGDGPAPGELAQLTRRYTDKLPRTLAERAVLIGAETAAMAVSPSTASGEVDAALPAPEANLAEVQGQPAPGADDAASRAQARAVEEEYPGMGGKGAAQAAAPTPQPAAPGRDRNRQGARLSLALQPDLRDWPSVRLASYDGDATVTVVFRNRKMAWTLMVLTGGIVGFLGVLFRGLNIVRRGALGLGLVFVGAVFAHLFPATIAPVAEGAALGGYFWLLLLLTQLARERKSTSSAPQHSEGVGSLRSSGVLLLLSGTLLCVPVQGVHAGGEGAEKQLTVIVPYNPAEGIPTRPSGVVYVPESTLRLLGVKEPGTAVPPDVPLGTVTRVVIEGTVDSDLVHFRAHFDIRCFSDSPTLVFLPLDLVSAKRVRLDGEDFGGLQRVEVREGSDTGNADAPRKEDGRLLKAGAHRTAVIVQGAGHHTLDVEFLLPVQGTAAVGSLTLTLIDCPPGSLRLRIPGKGVVVEASGLAGEFEILEGGEPAFTVLVAALQGAGRVRIGWRPAPRARADASIVVEQNTLIDVQESGIHLRSKVRYEVHNSSIDRIRFELPEGIAVLAVEGGEVGRWAVTTDDGRSPVLEVQLKQQFEGTSELLVDMLDTSAAPEGRYRLRVPFVPEAARESGTVAIGCGMQFRIHVEQRGMRQIPRNVARVPEPYEPDFCAVLGAYQYSGRDWEMVLEIARYVARLTSRSATLIEAGEGEWGVTSTVELNITDGPLGDFRIAVDRRLRLKEVHVDRPADWAFDREQGTLSVHLRQPAVGSVGVRFRAALSAPAGTEAGRLLLPTVEGAEKQEGELAVVVGSGLAIRATPQGGEAVAPSTLRTPWLRGRIQEIRYAARFRADQPAIQLAVFPVRPQTQATVGLAVVVGRESMEYLAEVHLSIRRGSLRQLQFVMPAAVGTGVEITGPAVAGKRVERAGEDTVRWIVEFSQPLTGSPRLLLWQRVPLEQHTLSVPWLMLESVERQDVFLAVRPEPQVFLEQQVREGLEQIRAEDVPAELPRNFFSEAAWVLRATSLPYKLEVERTVTQVASLPEIEVFLAHHRTLLDVGGNYRAELSLLLRNSTRQYLSVELPAEARLLNVVVDGEPRPVSKGGRPEEYLIPLAETPLEYLLQRVIVVFEGTLEKRAGVTSRYALPAAKVEKGVPVAYTLWTVYCPDGIWIRPVDTNLDRLELQDARVLEAVAISDAAVRAWQSGSRWGATEQQKHLGKTVDRIVRHLMSNVSSTEPGKASRFLESKLQGNVSVLKKSLEKFESEERGQTELQRVFEENVLLHQQSQIAGGRPKGRQREGEKLYELQQQSLQQLQVQSEALDRRVEIFEGYQYFTRERSTERRGRGGEAESQGEQGRSRAPRHLEGRLGIAARLTPTTNAWYFFKTRSEPRLVVEVWNASDLRRWLNAGSVALLFVGCGCVAIAMWLATARVPVVSMGAKGAVLLGLAVICAGIYLVEYAPGLAGWLAIAGGVCLACGWVWAAFSRATAAASASKDAGQDARECSPVSATSE